MSATLFLGFVASMLALVLAVSARFLSGRLRAVAMAALPAWLVYVGLLGYAGVIRNTTMRPPGIVFLFVPLAVILAFLILRVRSAAGTRVALAFPLWILLGMQCFRVIVELFLHQLWIEGLIPKMLTFAGANVDIYIGASAPFVAWAATRGESFRKGILVWNVVGLGVLANVVIRAVLTAPGPMNLVHAEVPNRMIGTFPFMFIPGFFVPLAVVLHVLAIRASTASQVS